MSSSFLTKGEESICVIKQGHKSHLVYKLEKREEYGFEFYGIFHRFELALNQDVPLLEQPYGPLGSCVDLSGRRVIGTGGGKPFISSSGKKIITLEHPVYSLIGRYSLSELQKVLDGYCPEEQDLPYVSISTSACAVADAGDDFYLNTLFFMSRGYGILTEISAVAGRAPEDCCSPEYYYKAYKVSLETNPLKRIQESDIISGATLVEWEVSSSPEITTPIKTKFSDNPEKIRKLEGLINKLFLTFTMKPRRLRKEV